MFPELSHGRPRPLTILVLLVLVSSEHNLPTQTSLLSLRAFLIMINEDNISLIISGDLMMLMLLLLSPRKVPAEIVSQTVVNFQGILVYLIVNPLHDDLGDVIHTFKPHTGRQVGNPLVGVDEPGVGPVETLSRQFVGKFLLPRHDENIFPEEQTVGCLAPRPPELKDSALQEIVDEHQGAGVVIDLVRQRQVILLVVVVVGDCGQQSLILHAEHAPSLLVVALFNKPNLRRPLLHPRLMLLLILMLLMVLLVLTVLFPLPNIPCLTRSEARQEHWVDDIWLSVSLAKIIVGKETTERVGVPVIVVMILVLPVVVPHFQDFFGLDFILFEYFLFSLNRFPGPGTSKRLETRHLGAAIEPPHNTTRGLITRRVRRQEGIGWSRWGDNKVLIYVPNMEIEQGHLS